MSQQRDRTLPLVLLSTLIVVIVVPFLPLLIAGPSVGPVRLPERSTFADVGATLAEWFGLGYRGRGTSFLPEIVA